ncbi:tRNA-dihydrouridine(20/20a) synthase [Terrihabitans soli]|uniref:tRNA-dihydrouridine(20/20a) synthase n=1 Tax=Terrihabitans soli TaxID=708113 RepID=A0A6S6QLU3_9HYPH|nr:tRNA dihydrouridine(20/20a) synthase DusA [Terrihabitans soli]BCJ90306.1 tRNA-dihydrouridine(20/20a) synthase [Terrihabitans soli]
MKAFPETMRFSVAPMMDWTDRHCRVFHRRLSRHALLYTEMVTTGAVLHGPRERLLGFSSEEQKVALQLGGSDPKDLAEAAKIGAEFGYAEINLNVGCPSDRVQDGRFGACLMREPELVGACVAAMKAAVDVPVTVKCRIGVDEQDTERALDALADHVTGSGVDGLIVHARKAWLQGLSPKENRDVPPLDYARVYRLKERFPHLPIAINGGIETLDEAKEHLRHVDGVMLGRAAYQNPGLVADVDAELFGAADRTDARAAALSMAPYIAAHIEKGGKVSNVTRHMLGLFAGLPGARAYRRHLAVEAVKPGATEQVLIEALGLVRGGAALAAA